MDLLVFHMVIRGDYQPNLDLLAHLWFPYQNLAIVEQLTLQKRLIMSIMFNDSKIIAHLPCIYIAY